MSELHPTVITITHGLLNAETSNDNAIVSTAAMIQALVADRGELRIKFGNIQGPLTDAGKAMSLAIDARAHIGRCHRRLHELGVEAGLFGPTSHGDVFPTVDDPEPVKQQVAEANLA